MKYIITLSITFLSLLTIAQKGAEDVQLFSKPVDANGGELLIQRGMEINNDTYMEITLAVKVGNRMLLKGFRVGLGSEMGSKDIYDKFITKEGKGLSDAKFEQREDVYYLTLGHWKGVEHIFANVKLEYLDGTVSPTFDVKR